MEQANFNLRFGTVDEDGINDLLGNKDSENTKKTTKTGVSVFRAYLTEKGLSTDFENLSKSDLASTLRKFYAEARTKKGELYTKNSLIGTRCAINRHVQSHCSQTGHPDGGINIVSDPEFSTANEVFQAQKVHLKRQGKAQVKHYPAIDEDDLRLLYQSGVLSAENPTSLLRKTFLELMLYVCRRGRENLRDLTKDHFAVGSDASGRRYVYQQKDELTKRQREDATGDMCDGGRMYELSGSPLCPVSTYMLYISKLHPSCSALFQKPRDEAKPEDEVWYCNAPVGKNPLGDMMATISKEAGLSKRYTNHSIRATCITLLDSQNFDARHIMSVSLHKNEESIRSYSHKTTASKKREMSDALSASLGLTAKKAKASKGEHHLENTSVASSSHSAALRPVCSSSSSSSSKPHTITWLPNFAAYDIQELPQLDAQQEMPPRRALPAVPQIPQAVSRSPRLPLVTLADNDLTVALPRTASASHLESPVPAPLPQIDDDPELDRFLASFNVNSLSQSTCMSVAPVLNNCNVTINYNFK